MPTVQFKGKVLPEISDLTVTNLPTFTFEEAPCPPDLPEGLKITYSFNIEHAAISLVCDVIPFDESLLSWVHNRATRITRAVVDIYSFATGMSLSVLLDRFIDEKGHEKKLIFPNPHLSKLCSVVNRETSTPDVINVGKALELVITDIDLAFSLRDLVSAITYIDESVINCARAIDGIRQIFGENEDDKMTGWRLLQENLRLTEDYVKFITKTSEKARHGNREHIPGSTVNEVTARSWTIMNRFVEYRLRGNQPLPATEFQLL
jgi:hypothetical protein